MQKTTYHRFSNRYFIIIEIIISMAILIVYMGFEARIMHPAICFIIGVALGVAIFFAFKTKIGGLVISIIYTVGGSTWFLLWALSTKFDTVVVICFTILLAALIALGNYLAKKFYDDIRLY